MGIKDKSRDFKFIVGTQDALHSHVWGIKLRGSEIYAMIGKGKEHKISFHKSGQNHSAITQEKREQFGLTFEERRAVNWETSLGKGESKVVYNIIFPNSELWDTPFDNTDDKILQIPLPLNENATVVMFVKTRTSDKQCVLTFVSPVELHLLYSTRLNSDYLFTVVYYYTNRFYELIENARSKFYQELTSLPTMPKAQKLRSGFVTISDSNGYFYRIDFKIT